MNLKLVPQLFSKCFREAFKAEGSLGQSIMFQPAKVTAVRARELEAASAAAALRERASHLDEEAQARRNMREVILAARSRCFGVGGSRGACSQQDGVGIEDRS